MYDHIWNWLQCDCNIKKYYIYSKIIKQNYASLGYFTRTHEWDEDYQVINHPR